MKRTVCQVRQLRSSRQGGQRHIKTLQAVQSSSLDLNYQCCYVSLVLLNCTMAFALHTVTESSELQESCAFKIQGRSKNWSGPDPTDPTGSAGPAGVPGSYQQTLQIRVITNNCNNWLIITKLSKPENAADFSPQN